MTKDYLKKVLTYGIGQERFTTVDETSCKTTHFSTILPILSDKFKIYQDEENILVEKDFSTEP